MLNQMSAPHFPTPPPHIRLVLSSEITNLDRVVEETQAFVSSHIKDDDLIYRIVLLTSEAVTNAIEHGNQLDPSKSVVLDVAVNAAHIQVCVEDEGQGFDRNAISDPLQEQNLLRNSGRGLFLIDSLADEHSYENQGRRIRMIFNLP